MPLSPADAARLLDALPSAALWLVGGRIAYANPAAGALLGVPAAELLGREANDLLRDEEVERVRARSEARDRGEGVTARYEVDARRPDGAPLRVELTVQALGPEERLVLIRDLGRQARDAALVVALSALAQRVQRQRTVEGVLAAAGAGLAELGLHVHAARQVGEELEVVYVDPGAPLVALMERQRGRPVLGARRPLSTMPLVEQVLGSGRSAFIDDLPSAAAAFYARLGLALPPEVRALAGRGYARAVLLPVVVDEASWGLLLVAGDNLTSADAAALALFSAQLGGSLGVAQAIEQLRGTNQQLAAIQAVAEAGSEAELGRLVPVLLEIAAEATESDRASIFMVEGRELVRAGSLSTLQREPAPFERLPLDGDSLPARCAREGKPRAQSVGAWHNPSGAALARVGLAEIAALPLFFQGRLAGALVLGRSRPAPYTAAELRAAEQLAGQIAVQLEKARLLEERHRRVQELSGLNEMMGGLLAGHLEPASVYGAGVRAAVRMVGVDRAYLILHEEGQSLQVAASEPPGQPALQRPAEDAPSLVWQALRERTPLVSEDVLHDPRVAKNVAVPAGFRAALAVPLAGQGEPLGVLLLADTRGPRAFSPQEVGLAVAAANQLAAAVINARLYAQERRRVEELRLLLEVSQVITGSLDADKVLDASAPYLARMIDCDEAFIWLFDPRTAMLRGAATANPAHREHFRSVSLSLQEQTAAARAMLARQVIRVQVAPGSPLINQQLLARYRVHSLLAIPLMLRDEAIGAVTIGDTRRPRPFTDAEVERATVVARQVAVAVANARLFEDLKRSYDELARAQAELVKRERLAALGELAAVVAHEVRNPLGVIFNSVTSLKRLQGPGSESTMLLDMVGEEADRLNRIVGDLLDFARPHEAELRPEPLEEVLRGAREAALALAGPGVELKVELDGPLAPVPVDARLLRQALLNLVVNAIQAMPRGGRVLLRASSAERGGRKVARVEVSDTGPGIPRGAADRIFQPFFTTKATGTGLGLAVVKRIVDAHHGEITVDSADGRGSTFTLWLPA